jgi:hypothetical protein
VAKKINEEERGINETHIAPHVSLHIINRTINTNTNINIPSHHIRYQMMRRRAGDEGATALERRANIMSRDGNVTLVKNVDKS